jgi:hypothetical protein
LARGILYSYRENLGSTGRCIDGGRIVENGPPAELIDRADGRDAAVHRVRVQSLA